MREIGYRVTMAIFSTTTSYWGRVGLVTLIISPVPYFFLFVSPSFCPLKTPLSPGRDRSRPFPAALPIQCRTKKVRQTACAHTHRPERAEKARDLSLTFLRCATTD